MQGKQPARKKHFVTNTMAFFMILGSSGIMQACHPTSPQRSEVSNFEISDAWHNRLQAIAFFGIGHLPQGAIITEILGMIWPARQPDLWSQISEQVEKTVDKKILAVELRQLESELNSIKHWMEYYPSIGTTEQASTLNNLIKDAESVFYKVSHKDNANAIHLLPVSVAMATIHLGLLKERADHGAKLFAPDNSQAIWDEELDKAINNYIAYFDQTFKSWQEWRNAQITVNIEHPRRPIAAVKNIATVIDNVTQAKQIFTRTAYNEDSFTHYPQSVKERFFNEANSQFIQELAIVFEFHKMSKNPDRITAKLPASMTKVTMGPYAWRLAHAQNVDDFSAPSNSEFCDDHTGITSIDVRAHDSVDGVRFNYTSASGKDLGAKSNYPTKIDMIGKKLKAVTTWWGSEGSSDILAAIQFSFEGDQKSEKMGHKNPSKWSDRIRVNTANMEGFSVVKACGRPGTYNGVTTLSMMKFDFWHDSLLPSK